MRARDGEETEPARRAIPALAGVDFESFRQQAIAFAALNLFVLAALLLLHSLFSSLLGPPSATLLVTLGAAFLLQMVALLWLWARSAPPGRRGPGRRRLDVDPAQRRPGDSPDVPDEPGGQPVLRAAGPPGAAGRLPLRAPRLHRRDSRGGFGDVPVGLALRPFPPAGSGQRVLRVGGDLARLRAHGADGVAAGQSAAPRAGSGWPTTSPSWSARASS